jgi:phage baseplate assembly protein W
MDDGRIFGRSIAFPPRIGADGRWAWSVGSDNIRESIEIILLTEVGERLMLGSFGGDMNRFLFEPNTPSTHRQIQERVMLALRQWEPRIIVQDVSVMPDPDDELRAVVVIAYRLVATQADQQLALAVQLS